MSDKLDRLLARLDEWMPQSLTEDDWKTAVAFRWRRKDTLFGKFGYLQAVKHVSPIQFSDLQHIDRQKKLILENSQIISVWTIIHADHFFVNFFTCPYTDIFNFTFRGDRFCNIKDF